jgi:copper chaperone
METAEIRVGGMTCGGCERSVQNALTRHRGVIEARADRRSERVSVHYDPALITRATIEQAITAAGFSVMD